MSTTWIDYKELRQRLDFKAVLELHGVTPKLKNNGTQHHGFCPLPTHNGKKNSPSFSANMVKKVFKCFGCQASGNVIEFSALMQGLDPRNSADFRKVALELQERFFPGSIKRPPVPKPHGKENEKAQGATNAPAPAQEGRLENAPLDFELKRLDAAHPYLLGRGFRPETITEFGLGYASQGLMKGRVAIPLHNSEGTLIGYAGRLADDALISDSEPKYKFPPPRTRQGVLHEFHKSVFLYNAHRLTSPLTDLIVLEGFPAVWWLWQAGYKNVVALMGSSASDEQVGLIIHAVMPTGHVLLFSDGDPAGHRCAADVLVKVAPHRAVRWVKADDGKQPTDYMPEQLHALLREGGKR